MASGLVSYNSASKMDQQRPSRISQSSVSSRSRLEQQQHRPSLPDLLAAEGLEKPEYTTGYVQKIRQQYLQLIAASNQDCQPTLVQSSTKQHAPLPPPLLPHPVVKQPLQNGVVFSTRFRESENVEKPPQSRSKIIQESESVPGITLRVCRDELSPSSGEMPRSQLVSSLRAVFDKTSPPPQQNGHNTLSQTIETPLVSKPPSLKPTHQPAPPPPSAPLVAHSDPPRNNISHDPMEVSTSNNNNNNKPILIHSVSLNEPLVEVKPKQKEQVFGERIIIFKGRSFQNVHTPPVLHHLPKPENGVRSTPDLLLSSKNGSNGSNNNSNKKENNSNDVVDRFLDKLPDSAFSDDEDDEEPANGTVSFNFKIVGGSAVIKAKPMWLRREANGRAAKQLRFDDNVDVFGYPDCEVSETETEGENGWGSVPALDGSSHLCSGIDFDSHTRQLGLRPIVEPQSPLSTSNTTANSCAQEQKMPAFGPTCPRDTMDMVF